MDVVGVAQAGATWLGAIGLLIGLIFSLVMQWRANARTVIREDAALARQIILEDAARARDEKIADLARGVHETKVLATGAVEKITVLEKQTNSMKDELVAEVRKNSYKNGVADQHTRQVEEKLIAVEAKAEGAKEERERQPVITASAAAAAPVDLVSVGPEAVASVTAAVTPAVAEAAVEAAIQEIHKGEG